MTKDIQFYSILALCCAGAIILTKPYKLYSQGYIIALWQFDADEETGWKINFYGKGQSSFLAFIIAYFTKYSKEDLQKSKKMYEPNDETIQSLINSRKQ